MSQSDSNPGWLGATRHLLEETSSTNDVATQLAREGAPHGTVVVAKTQTRGRGRHGRVWHSPPGLALYYSAIFRPEVSPSAALPITLAAAIAVQDLITELAIPAAIKWPNDIFAGAPGKKISGILTEMATSGLSLSHIVLGIGINVNHRSGDFPPELQSSATSVAIESGQSQAIDTIERRLSALLELHLNTFFSAGFAPLAPLWRTRTNTFGKWISGSDERGHQIQGEAFSLADDGALLIRTADESVVRMTSGEILERSR